MIGTDGKYDEQNVSTVKNNSSLNPLPPLLI